MGELGIDFRLTMISRFLLLSSLMNAFYLISLAIISHGSFEQSALFCDLFGELHFTLGFWRVSTVNAWNVFIIFGFHWMYILQNMKWMQLILQLGFVESLCMRSSEVTEFLFGFSEYTNILSILSLTKYVICWLILRSSQAIKLALKWLECWGKHG